MKITPRITKNNISPNNILYPNAPSLGPCLLKNVSYRGTRFDFHFSHIASSRRCIQADYLHYLGRNPYAR